ncbi:GNAT family N-acetyltransferase [Leucobacter chromiireducens]|uniref:GNAT family N-acetyltransferase n=1 Tax=Leucobacter chromiireducens TaxID=283877 RepID=UPI00192917B2
MSIAVRQARREEFAAVDALIGAAYAHDYGETSGGSDPFRAAAVRARDYDVWVAEDSDGQLLGSVTTRRPGGPSLHEDIAADELDLRLLGVSPAARRRGVGAALMRDVAARAAGEGFSAVVLKTGPAMRGAHRLYETLGYERRPERDGLWIGGEHQLDLFTYAYPLVPLVEAPLADESAARGVLGAFPTGVVALAARGAAGEPAAALTVQSFVSLSVAPPRVLLTVGTGSSSWPRIAASGSFAATVLGAGQGPIARRLARPGVRDKLGGTPTVRTPTRGHPVIAGGSAWLECAIREEFDGGDHRIVLADVLTYGLLGGVDRPLIYARSRFGGFAGVA